jgi:type IV pilus assembly protein PilC
MPLYLCRVARTDGTISVERVEAEDADRAKARLQELGYLIFSIRPNLTDWSALFGRGHRFAQRDFLIFSQELSALLKAGIPILRSLDLLIDRASHHGFQQTLRQVRERVKGGASLSDAMGEHPIFFPELCVASIRSGEQTGTVVEMLARYMVFLQRMITITSKVRSAMVYPIFLIAVGIAVIMFLIVYVVPQFTEVYQDAQVEMPLMTLWLLAVVEIVGRTWLWLLAGIAVVLVAARWMASRKETKAWVDRWVLHLPFIGEGVKAQHVIGMTRTLATTLQGGIPLVPALRMVQSSMTNGLLASRVADVADAVTQGSGLAPAMARVRLMPRLSLEMIEVGEAAGALPQMLAEVAEFHETELDRQLQRLIWIEPIILLVMGAMVAFIVISVYLPIFRLAGAIVG